MKRIERLFLNDHFILFLIILNAALIFIQEFDGIPIWITDLDNVFTILFTIEALVKITEYGFKGYWHNNWNKFDFILVSLAVISIFQSYFGTSDTSFNILLTLRVLRVFKSFRLIRFVPNISSIIDGLQRAVKASSIVILAFFIMLFIVGIFTCSLFKEIAPEYFDTPLNSIYSVFKVFSSEGWDIADTIASRTSRVIGVLSKAYFIVLLFIGGIIGISLINSVFVDSMVSGTNDQIKAMLEDVKRKIDKLSEEDKK